MKKYFIVLVLMIMSTEYAFGMDERVAGRRLTEACMNEIEAVCKDIEQQDNRGSKSATLIKSLEYLLSCSRKITQNELNRSVPAFVTEDKKKDFSSALNLSVYSFLESMAAQNPKYFPKER